jgi:hypothetical protein
MSLSKHKFLTTPILQTIPAKAGETLCVVLGVVVTGGVVVVRATAYHIDITLSFATLTLL